MDWWTKPRNVSVVVDTPGRWFDPFASKLVEEVNERGDNGRLIRNVTDVLEGGVAFYLSCYRITPPHILTRNPHNLVVHASDLPQGRGFSPSVYQVREGKNRIPLTMIFAEEQVDSGDIVMKRDLILEGHELHDEFRSLMGERIVEMCLEYLGLPEPPAGTPQTGEPSWYPKVKPEESRLDPSRPIAEQFDLLRSVDNENFPAFFDHCGHRYELKIVKARMA